MFVPFLSKAVKTPSYVMNVGRFGHQFIYEFVNTKRIFGGSMAAYPMDAYTYRKLEVHHYQRALNMEPRCDSTLTEMYARGEVYMSAVEVARELMATDFIYKNTLYGEVIEDFMRDVADRLRYIHSPLSWSSTWTIVRAYAPIALKLMLLSGSGLRIPNKLSVPNNDVVPSDDASNDCARE